MGFPNMTSHLNVSLPDELRCFADSQVGDEARYSTLSEYICDLIRRDLQDSQIASDIVQGIREVAEGQFASESIRDILNEK